MQSKQHNTRRLVCSSLSSTVHMADLLHIIEFKFLHMPEFLHMTELFFTGTTCGACDKDGVCLGAEKHTHSSFWFNLFLKSFRLGNKHPPSDNVF